MERFIKNSTLKLNTLKILVGIFLIICVFATTTNALDIRWRNDLTGGCAGCLDAVTGYVDGDPMLIWQDDGGTYKAYLYRYDSDPTGSPAENSPDVIAPDDIGENPGRWMLVEFYAKVLVVSPSSTSPGQITFYEDTDEGTNYIILTIPSAVDSNETFIVGNWRIEAKTLTDAGFNIEVDETHTTFVCTITGLTADRAGVLPPATGSGVEYYFYILDGDDTYAFQVQPDSTDIIGTGGAGHYFEADGAGELMYVQDVAVGKWLMFNLGAWTEEK
ncbi:MAG: hypothetical protein ACTSRU_20590 [Candidatus Hodarchaeales archaeon]